MFIMILMRIWWIQNEFSSILCLCSPFFVSEITSWFGVSIVLTIEKLCTHLHMFKNKNSNINRKNYTNIILSPIHPCTVDKMRLSWKRFIILFVWYDFEWTPRWTHFRLDDHGKMFICERNTITVYVWI